MDRIESMLSDAFEDDAARFRETTFVEHHGGAVQARVRRRRRTKAAGYSALGVAAVAAAGLAVLPSHDEALTPADAPACLPFDHGSDWWDSDGDGEKFLTSYGLNVDVALSTSGLEISDATGDPEPLVIPVEDRLLAGTTADGEILHVTLSTGKEVSVALSWSDKRISVTYDTGGAGWATVSIESPKSGLESLAPETRYWNFGGSFSEDDAVFEVLDAATGEVALTVDVDSEGTADVTFADGGHSEFDAGDDGFVTFEWVGVTTIQLYPDPLSPTMHLGDEVWSDVDAQVVGPEYCLPFDGATTDASQDSAEASRDAFYTVDLDE